MSRFRPSPSLPFATLSVLFASVFLLGSTTVSAQSLTEVRPLSVNEQIIQENTDKLIQKSDELTVAEEELNQLEAKKSALTKQIEEEKKAIEELKKKIADKKAADERAKAEAARQVQVAQAPVSAPTRVASAPVSSGGGLRSGCGDNQYAAYIYGQESGGRVTGMCNTTIYNAGGCYGIGQACPGSKVAHCGADYACQNAWFTNYAMSRYGSWVAAYNFHKNNGWW